MNSNKTNESKNEEKLIDYSKRYQKKKIKNLYLTKEDIDMLNDSRQKTKNQRNVCDCHQDGA